MAKHVQIPLDGTEQKRIPAIERAINKADEMRNMIAGLKDQLKTLEFKLSEVMRANAGELFKEESVKGERVLVYKRGDFSASIKEREAVLYKVADSSKGEPPEEDQTELV